MPLDIIIIGAGVAGLGAALAAARAGHNVRLYERDRTWQGQGWATCNQPATVRLLREWGVDFDTLEPAPFDNQPVYSLDDMSLLYINEMGFQRNEWGVDSPHLLFARGRTHKALLDRIKQYDNIKIVTGVALVSADLEQARVVLSDGSTVQGDLLVGADGVSSKVYEAFPKPAIQHYISKAIRRPERNVDCIVSIEEARKDPETRALVDSWPKGHLLNMYFPSLRVNDPPAGNVSDYTGPVIVVLPFQRGELIDFYIERQDPSVSLDTGLWNIDLTPEEFWEAGQVDKLPGPIQKLLKLGKHHRRWTYGLRDAPLRFIHGKSIVIGDAAHPVHPNTGTGNSLAIEDAGCLGVLLEHATKDNLGGRLRLFDYLRHSRCCKQKYAGESRMEGKGSSAVMFRRLCPREALPTDSLHASRELWAYNVSEVTRQALKASGLP